MKKSSMPKRTKNLWEQRTQSQFRNWTEKDKICNFIRSRVGRFMPANLIKTGLSSICEPLEMNINPWERFFIPQIGIAEHSKGYYHSRVNKDFIDILIVAKGAMGVRGDSVKFLVRKNEMLVIPPNNLCDTFIPSVNTTLYWLHLTANPFWNTRVGGDICVVKSERFSQVISLMDIYKEEIFSAKRNLEIIKSLANAIGENFLEIFPNRDDLKFLSFNELFDKVKKSPQKDWSSSKIAQRLRISQPTLNARCREFCGMTFAEKVSSIRMERALELARKGFTNVKIAKALGFANAYSFANAFHDRFGVYPSVFF